MTILVTGGSGFIGSHFVLDWFAAFSEPLINLDKLTYAANPRYLQAVQANPCYHFIEGDIADRSLVLSLLKEHRVRAIVHIAAESHVDRSIQDPAPFIQTNVLGTFELLEAGKMHWASLSSEVRSQFRFLHVSTDEVYGSLAEGEPAFTENHPYAPNNPYSASKAASDHLVRAYHQTYGLPTLITHCSNNYGPHQYPEKFIPKCIQRALADQPLMLYGDGLQIRDWLFVSDHCSAIRTVLSQGNPGEVYHIGGDQEKRNRDLLHTLCHQLDALKPRQDGRSYAERIVHVPDRLGHDRRYAIDASKISRCLGWQPKETFESGLRKTLACYLSENAPQSPSNR